MLGYVVPLALVGAHVSFLRSNYVAMIGSAAAFEAPPLTTSLILATLYVVFVVVGVRVMKHREAMQLKAAMQVYNVYETALSATMLYFFVTEVVGRNPLTMPIDRSPAGSRLAFAIWLSYQSKFIEYADTLFMITRKVGWRCDHQCPVLPQRPTRLAAPLHMCPTLHCAPAEV